MIKAVEALEKINHTICLNKLENNIKFGLDKWDHCDCSDFKEFSECYTIVLTELLNKKKSRRKQRRK